MTQNDLWFEKLTSAMPWGSGTSSKRARLRPEEPAVLTRGKGCRVWDADGKEYIDFRCGLGPVTLGYGFEEVDNAIVEQLQSGISFSYPTRLEYEVAERMLSLRPHFGKVKFLKSGGEACAAAIRLARGYTGRAHIVQIGYNGWLNALASGSKVLPGQAAPASLPGVPEAIGGLHHAAVYGDIGSVERFFTEHAGDVAAVMVSADYAGYYRGDPFYKNLRELCDRHGALLMCDEIVTGFRCALGGVSEFFGFESDLSVFAKGFANGMPLSAVVGRKEILDLCDIGGGITISSTYAGETLSLAAAKTVIDIYRRENVVQHLWDVGKQIWDGANAIFDRHGLPLVFRGAYPAIALTAREGAPPDSVDRFMRQACKHGILLYACSYVSFSHKEGDIAEALNRLEAAARDTNA